MDILLLLVAALPIAVLLGGILLLRWRAPRAAALAWLVAVAGAAGVFGAGPVLLAAASAKGLSLALLVMLIVWAAVVLYALADDLGAIRAIAARLLGTADDPVMRALLLAWAFSGFLQGIAGFGVPVAVVAPLMLLAGFGPVASVAAVMIGHSWAITFGSMGSSFFTIQLVAGLSGAALGPPLALLFGAPMFLTGLSVAHIAGGWTGAVRAVPVVALAAALMTGLMWALNVAGAAAVSSMLPGLLGALVVWGAGRVRRGRRSSRSVALHPPETALAGTRAGTQGGPAPLPRGEQTSTAAGARSGVLVPIRLAVLPYALLAALSLGAQIPVVRETVAQVRFALDYPPLSTARGFAVAAQPAYAPIRLVGHPAPLLLLSALVTALVYTRRGLWRRGALGRAWRSTVRQATGTTVGVALMVMTALVVADSGMAAALARAAEVLGSGLYLLASPFLGLLGAFVTGSNTNSNVMFGPLQLYAARALGLSALAVAAAQTLGGSVGSGVAPDKALIGSSLTQGEATEGEILRRALPYGLLVVLAIGLEVLTAGLLGML